MPTIFIIFLFKPHSVMRSLSQKCLPGRYELKSIQWNLFVGIIYFFLLGQMTRKFLRLFSKRTSQIQPRVFLRGCVGPIQRLKAKAQIDVALRIYGTVLCPPIKYWMKRRPWECLDVRATIWNDLKFSVHLLLQGEYFSSPVLCNEHSVFASLN